MTDSVNRLGTPIGVPARSTCSLDRSYVRTDGRTNAESWLGRREILTFRNACAHIRNFLSADFQGQR